MSYWLMSMKWMDRGGKRKDYSGLCKKLGILAIGYFIGDNESLGNLKHINHDHLKSLVRHHSASSLWDFAHEMQIGDVVYIRGKRPGTTVGRARITSEYKYDKNLFINEPEWEEYLYWDHYRNAKWDLDFPKIKASLTKKKYYTIEKLKESDVRDFEQKHGLKPFPPIKTSKGKIIVPCQLKAVRNGKIWFPFPNYFSPFYESAVLIGEWSRGVVKWELSEIITIDPNISCRLCEPTVVELKDGRLSMVMRGDNGAFPEKPGYKWYSVSEDGGYTWTKPKPLKYTNGKPIFSPSSCSLLFRSWKTGKIYWIANILDKNPVGNRPRYPLQIVEIDEEKLAVKKETMLVIDDRKRGDSPLVQFSNFRYYQDRVTGDLVILMARYGEKSGKENILRSPLYRYVIELD